MRVSSSMIGVLAVALVCPVFGQDDPAPSVAKPPLPDALRAVAPREVVERSEPAAQAPAQPRETAQPPAKPAAAFPYQGVITGSNVNVRSGNGTNYYRVTRLQKGARVNVLGAMYGWAKIEPPPGCYSLVDIKFVDRGNDDTGVVNGDNVLVRAGSDLSPKNYAVQVEAQLERGDKVTIIGEDTESGFYKIKPPAGAALWVHGDYVKPAGSAGAVALKTPARDASPREAAADARPSARNAKRAKPSTVVSTTVGSANVSLQFMPGGPARDAIAAIEAELARERAKPMMVQALGPIATKLERVAETADNTVAQVYAQQRARQLRNWMALVEDVKAVQQTSDQVVANRRPWTVKPRRGPASEEYDAEGELRPSQVFNSKAMPRRYRLVDPTRTPARTVAYIELPPDSKVSVERLVGEYVWVRAANRSQLPTAGRSIPVIIPAEIIVQAAEDETDIQAIEPADLPKVIEPTEETDNSENTENDSTGKEG